MISSWIANWHEKLFNDPCLTAWLVYDWLITVWRNVTGNSRDVHLHKLLDNINRINRYKKDRKKDCFCTCKCPCTCTKGLTLAVQLITWLTVNKRLYSLDAHLNRCSRNCQSLEAATGTSDHDLITLNKSRYNMMPSDNIYRYTYLSLWKG